MSKTDYLPSNALAFQNLVYNVRTRVTVTQSIRDIL
jgi:hypothetical protein